MRRARLWRAGEAVATPGLSTGFEALDVTLPGGGWPFPGLVEILGGQPGNGGLRLLLPALAQLSRQSRWLVWVAPPYQPYAPTLQAAGIALQRVMLVDLPTDTPGANEPARPAASDEMLWSFEQALRFPDCGAALLWPREMSALCLRRLQLACEAGGTLGVLFRRAEYATQPSPAALRLLLAPQPACAALDVTILKCRGSPRVRECRLSFRETSVRTGLGFGRPGESGDPDEAIGRIASREGVTEPPSPRK